MESTNTNGSYNETAGIRLSSLILPSDDIKHLNNNDSPTRMSSWLGTVSKGCMTPQLTVHPCNHDHVQNVLRGKLNATNSNHAEVV